MRGRRRSAAPAYRRAPWPRHRTANDERIRKMRALVERHGAAVRDPITRAYAQPWPAGGSAIFYAADDAVRRGITGPAGYAEANGMW